MKTIFVNGCFDILHRGHFELFEHARALGDQLIVAIDSDEKIKKDKGPARPFNTMIDRQYALSRLVDIDTVLTFNTTKGLEDLICAIKPDIMVVGSDWRDKTIVGAQFAKEIKFFERIDGYSTTKIIQGAGFR
tara:strand:+ start:717 stop:1115 length:399 start_codon:yes stop_codon:yes gene_type:complete